MLLDISERAGDKNVGQTLLRLARLAEAAHRYEIARQSLNQFTEDKRRVEGLDSRAAGTPPRTQVPGAGSSHTEVAR